jgi:small multidrug resistance pump
MGYLFLALTIVAETAAVIYMKLAHGFQNKLNASIAILAYLLGFIFLTLALKYLPVGLANAIWAGASTVLVAVLGVYLFKEQLTILQLVSLILIVLGLVGLNIEKVNVNS